MARKGNGKDVPLDHRSLPNGKTQWLSAFVARIKLLSRIGEGTTIVDINLVTALCLAITRHSVRVLGQDFGLGGLSLGGLVGSKGSGKDERDSEEGEEEAHVEQIV